MKSSSKVFHDPAARTMAGLLQWADSRAQRDGRLERRGNRPGRTRCIGDPAIVWGGEPDDAQVRDALAAQGVSADDLLGFYTLRTVPQWLRERKISDVEDARLPDLINAELARNRERLALRGFPLARLRGVGLMVRAHQRQAIWGGFRAGRDRAARRRTTCLKLIRHADFPGALRIPARFHRRTSDAGATVMVVFGKSHSTIQRPALDAMLGNTCHAGSELTSAAPRRCWSGQGQRQH